MLSILIPVFNEDIRALADDLKALTAHKNNIEVIFGDDASDNTVHQNENISHIKSIANFKYIVRKENLKYCANRNLLAEESSYENLLFLDADVRIKNEHFIDEWIKYINEESVYCGGNNYQNDRPLDKKLVLKWYHGKMREETSLAYRKAHPYLRFSSSNFLISKKIFLKHSFDEKSRSYGYNDTVYAYSLMQNSIEVIHIDNPVLNTGLMTDNVFLLKTKEAVENLIFFENRPYVKEDFRDYIKVLKMYYKIKKLGLSAVFRIVLKAMEDNLINGLFKEYPPNLRNLDLLKLYYLLEAKRS